MDARQADGRGDATHLLIDVKVISPLTSDGRAKHSAAAYSTLGGVGQAASARARREYARAATLNHTVAPLVHSVFGSLDRTAVDLLDDLDKRAKGKLPDPDSAPWTARTFRKLHTQSLTTAVQLGVARQILAAGSNAHGGTS